MTTWYSDHLGTDGIADSSLSRPNQLKDVGLTHSRLRVKRMMVSLAGASPTPAASDVVRMGTFKMTDRIYEVYLNVDTVMGSAGTADIGFYLSGANHDGAVIDADLFGSAISLNSTGRTEVFAESAVLETHQDRGKTIRQMINEGIGATTYDESDVQVDLCLGLAGTLAAAGVFVVEVWYTAGD